MILDTLLPPDRVIRLRAADKSTALAELARRMAVIASQPPRDIASALAAREALGSTGVGNGVAVPHARLPGLSELAALFARLERPVEWAAIDGRPVDLVFLMLSPAGIGGEHLAALAAVTRRLRDPTVAAAIRAARDPASIYAALLG